MSLMRMPFTIPGQWATGLTLVAFFIAGCDPNISLPSAGGGDGSGSLSDNSFGVIVNTDSTKDLIGGVRMKTGESAYAFGTFNPDGSVGEVTAATYQNAAGQVAKLLFESGRPVRAVGFDGTTLTISYTTVNAQHLAGTATYNPAGAAPVSVNFDIDLQQTAAEVATRVQNLFHISTSAEPPPSSPTAGSTGTGGSARTLGAAAGVKSHVGVLLVPIIIAITGFAIVMSISQIAQAFVAVGNSIAMAFLTPFILMGNLMRAATGQPLITVDYDPLHPVINIPRP